MPDQVYELRITLKDSKPPIWRQVAVPGNLTLGGLHEVIQIVMGWDNDHLHQFVLKEKVQKPTPEETRRLIEQRRWGELEFRQRGLRFFAGLAPDGSDVGMDGEDEYDTAVAEVCSKPEAKLTYEYDFGDGWNHLSAAKKTYPPKEGIEYPVCLAGALACPPEDCGGIWGYYNLLEALANPKHEDHEQADEWLGADFDAEAFDPEHANAQLAALRRACNKRRPRRRR